MEACYSDICLKDSPLGVTWNITIQRGILLYRPHPPLTRSSNQTNPICLVSRPTSSRNQWIATLSRLPAKFLWFPVTWIARRSPWDPKQISLSLVFFLQPFGARLHDSNKETRRDRANVFLIVRETGPEHRWTGRHLRGDQHRSFRSRLSQEPIVAQWNPCTLIARSTGST